MRKKDFSSLLLTATDQVVGTATDFLLISLVYYPLSMFGATSPAKIYRATEEAFEMRHVLGYETIKRSLHALAKSGMIRRLGASRSEIQITDVGYKRIAGLFPTYQTTRPWDGHIYLISYDVPNSANHKRDRLRLYIKKTGGALLQESLWVTPYNPTLLLYEFQEKNKIPGTILVSRLGHDGAIGDETLSQLIARVYRLSELTERYDAFIETFKNQPSPNPLTVAIAYLGILKDDPQLPFELIPEGFPAETAYTLFRRLTDSETLHPAGVRASSA